MKEGAIGIFGGTFNPIHCGHISAAQEVQKQLSLSRILFIPTGNSPHKVKGTQNEIIAPATARLAWLKMAIERYPCFEVDPMEVERQGPSYSVETLAILGEKFCKDRLIFLIGHEAFAHIDTWYESKKLFELVNFAVIMRLPVREGTIQDWLPKVYSAEFCVSDDGKHARHKQWGTTIRIIQIQGLEISATDLRCRLRKGQPASDLIPEAAHQAIIKDGFYGPGKTYC